MSSALVRYGARAALPYVRRAGNLKRVQMAARAIQMAYRNRKSIKRAGTKIVRWAKRRKTTKYGSRMRAVQPKNRSTARSDANATGATGLPLGSLSFQTIQYPTRDLIHESLNSRAGIYIFLKGIKFCRQFEVIAQEEGLGPIRPIIMHYALVELKDTDMDPATYSNQFRTKFFRAFNEQGDRHQPFVDNLAVSGWNSNLNCLNMNPDGEFNIIWHKRRRMQQPTLLSNDTLNGNVPPHKFIWHFEKYIKFKKRISYTNIDSSLPQHPMVELFWYQTLTPENYPTPGNGTWVRTWNHHTVYYANKRP